MRSNGGFIGGKKTVLITAASGVWTLRDAQRERGAKNWTGYTPGIVQAEPANSAYEIKTLNPSAADGLYWINDGTDTFQVYCDMTRNGGGWMLAASIRGGNSSEVQNTAAAGLSTPVYQPSSTANWGKFSDARINRMRARSQSQTYGYTGNWPWWMEGAGYSAGDIQNFVYKDAITFSVNTLPESDSIWRRITNTYNEASATYDSSQVPNSGTKGWGMHHQSDASKKRTCWARHPESGGSCAWNTDTWGIPTYGHVWVK